MPRSTDPADDYWSLYPAARHERMDDMMRRTLPDDGSFATIVEHGRLVETRIDPSFPDVRPPLERRPHRMNVVAFVALCAFVWALVIGVTYAYRVGVL